MKTPWAEAQGTGIEVFGGYLSAKRSLMTFDF